MKPHWTNVFPAVVTQLKRDQSLDLKATARHFEVLIDSGVAGLIVCGSLGENQSLAPEEKRAVVQCAVEVSAGRVPVLSGVAESSTRAAIEYLQDVERLGARRFHDHAGDGLQSRRPRGAALVSHAGESDAAAVDALQQPGLLSGGYHAGALRRVVERKESRGDQGVFREHAPHHRAAQHGRRPLRHLHRRRRPHAGKLHPWHRRLGGRQRHRFPEGKPDGCGIWRARKNGTRRARSTAGRSR